MIKDEGADLRGGMIGIPLTSWRSSTWPLHLSSHQGHRETCPPSRVQNYLQLELSHVIRMAKGTHIGENERKHRGWSRTRRDGR